MADSKITKPSAGAPAVTSQTSSKETPPAQAVSAPPSTAWVGQPKPKDAFVSGASVRAPAALSIANPVTNPLAHAEDYGTVTKALGVALDRFAQKYPGVDRRFAGRFLELALGVGAQVPLMVYSHELGHAGEAKRQGMEASARLTGWASGYTSWKSTTTPTTKEELALFAAGSNQQQLNAEYMYSVWARNGTANTQEALGYLLSQMNTALYAARTVARGGAAPESDDIAAYLDRLQQNGQNLTRGQLLTMSLATDLASAPTLAALFGELRFLATGDRQIEMPTLTIGDVKTTFPHLHTLLTTEGPVLGGTVVVNPDKKLPVEVSFDARVDGSAFAAGAKLYDVPLAKNVTLNPFIRGTMYKDGGAGVMVGTDVRVRVYKDASLTGTVAFRHDDLLAQPQGQKNGVTARVGFSVPF
ncbi:MAG: hypothetical protein ACOZIN_05360 [Myxococcota bacterium]